MSKKLYAVKEGRKKGIYNSWKDCQEQVIGHSGAIFKSFKNKEDAENFMQDKEEVISKKITKEKEIEKNVGKDVEKKHKTKHDEAMQLSNQENTVSIYTDGTWGDTDNGKMYAGGFLIIKDSKIIVKEVCNGSKKGYAEMRNIAGEIQAVKKAIEYVAKNMKDIENIYIFSDYNGVSYWTLPKEDADNFEAKNKYTKEYVKYINKKKEKFNIEITHVKGHNHDVFNEEADTLASYSKYLFLNNKSYNEKEFWEDFSYINEKKIDIKQREEFYIF